MLNPDCPAKAVPILTVTLLLSSLPLFCEPVQAQVQQSRQNAHSAQSPTPQPGARQTPRDAPPSYSAPSIPGTGLPSATQPADPPSSLDPSRFSGPRGNAQTSTPGPPPDPDQVPVDGGLGWLAAAGAAYAANRLRNQSVSGDDE